MAKSNALQFIDEMGLTEKYNGWLNTKKATKSTFDYGEFLSDSLTWEGLAPNKFYAVFGCKDFPAGRTMDSTCNLFLGGDFIYPSLENFQYREITEDAFKRILTEYNNTKYGKRK